MRLSQLLIQDFRNIEHAQLTFSPQTNVIIGQNGSGKTNLLEAIYMLGHGRAFRLTQVNRIIRHEQSAFTLHGKIQHHDTVFSVGLSKSKQGDNRVKINGNDGCKMAELAQLLPIQLITPEGFSLLTGGPKYRRAYLDWGCFHEYPAFFMLWHNIKHLLKQRNAALKQATHYAQLAHWDQALVQFTLQLTQLRAQYAQQLWATIHEISQLFLPEFTLNGQFYSGWDNEHDYATLLEHQFPRDKQLQYTTFGAHKADFRLRADQVPVDALLSRGQLKLLMCALRIAQGKYLFQQTQHPCLFLIDDLNSELDIKRQTLLVEQLRASHSQVFISAIEREQINSVVQENDKIFSIKSGRMDRL